MRQIVDFESLLAVQKEINKIYLSLTDEEKKQDYSSSEINKVLTQNLNNKKVENDTK
jgi:hypothetical protein